MHCGDVVLTHHWLTGGRSPAAAQCGNGASLRRISPVVSPSAALQRGEFYSAIPTLTFHKSRSTIATEMNKITIAALSIFVATHFVVAAERGFPGLKSLMDPETYARTGLNNLTPEQRAELDVFIRDYVAGKQKEAAEVAATQAVERAVKERKVQPPEVIETSIVGTYSGYGTRTLFHLANGQTWKPTSGDVVTHAPIQSPRVVLYRDFFGYKMFVENDGLVRVKKVK
jgi:hypothetical protein